MNGSIPESARTAMSASPSLRPSVALLFSALFVLGGCGGDVRRAIGLDRTGPDEFRVVSRAPLDLPPEFGLRPPQPGAPRPNEPSARDQARSTVFGANARPDTQLGDRTPGENTLLRRAGAVNPDPTIRETVNRETSQLARADRTLVDRLIFWREPDPPGSAVDATNEARRLRENSALGRPVTDGTTPVIQRKRRGILEGLF